MINAEHTTVEAQPGMAIWVIYFSTKTTAIIIKQRNIKINEVIKTLTATTSRKTETADKPCNMSEL